MNKIVGTLFVAFMALGSAVSAQDSAVGDWFLVSNVDLITDENKSLIAAQATEHPTYADYSAIIIRCDEYSRYGVELYFHADKYLGIEDTYSVVYRVDGGTPQRGNWSASTDNEAAFAPNLGVSGVINALLDAEELVFRISAYSTDYTYVLPISGLREAIQKLGCYTGTL